MTGESKMLEITPVQIFPNFTVQGLRRRCAQNTETTAVKPRVGIAQITKRCFPKY